MSLLERMLTAKAAGQTLAEMERVLSGLGVHEQEVLQIYLESKNRAHIDDFASTPYEERILLLPQCLRAQDCPAKLDQKGYSCMGCRKCAISNIIEEATQLGYRTFILPGGTMVERIFREYRPRACLGVACLKEIVLGSMASERNDIATIGVPLLLDGCVATKVDWDEVRRKIRLSKREIEQTSRHN